MKKTMNLRMLTVAALLGTGALSACHAAPPAAGRVPQIKFYRTIACPTACVCCSRLTIPRPLWP